MDFARQRASSLPVLVLFPARLAEAVRNIDTCLVSWTPAEVPASQSLDRPRRSEPRKSTESADPAPGCAPLRALARGLLHCKGGAARRHRVMARGCHARPQ